ncbi:hypothetical protein TorRG33x02_247710, partial [Trema orientale]
HHPTPITTLLWSLATRACGEQPKPTHSLVHAPLGDALPPENLQSSSSWPETSPFARAEVGKMKMTTLLPFRSGYHWPSLTSILCPFGLLPITFKSNSPKLLLSILSRIKGLYLGSEHASITCLDKKTCS